MKLKEDKRRGWGARRGATCMSMSMSMRVSMRVREREREAWATDSKLSVARAKPKNAFQNMYVAPRACMCVCMYVCR